MLRGAGPQQNLAPRFCADLARAIGAGKAGPSLPADVSAEEGFSYVYAICYSLAYRGALCGIP